MNKLTCLCFLLFLALPLKSAHKEYCPDRLQVSSKLEDFGVQDESNNHEFEYEFEDSISWESDHSNKVLVNVDAFGAVGDGVSDDTQAFADAWKKACSASRSVFLVPEGRLYLVNATRFKGPCGDKIIIQIEGTIVAPDDPKTWNPKSPRTWLGFYYLHNAFFQGNGVIDGAGSKWWAAKVVYLLAFGFCVPQPCKGAPTVRFHPKWTTDELRHWPV